MSLKGMENESENTVPELATANQRWCIMTNDKSILYYRLSLTVFQKWLAEGIITQVEFERIKALIADKYDLPKCSIYR